MVLKKIRINNLQIDASIAADLVHQHGNVDASVTLASDIEIVLGVLREALEECNLSVRKV